jgi:hypothetical protein
MYTRHFFNGELKDAMISVLKISKLSYNLITQAKPHTAVLSLYILTKMRTGMIVSSAPSHNEQNLSSVMSFELE